MPTEAAALQIVTRLDVAEKLEQHADKGMTIAEIATAVNADPLKIGGPMRKLTASGWFTETEGGRFHNTKLSRQLANESGKSWTIAS